MIGFFLLVVDGRRCSCNDSPEFKVKGINGILVSKIAKERMGLEEATMQSGRSPIKFVWKRMPHHGACIRNCYANGLKIFSFIYIHLFGSKGKINLM